MGIAEFTVAVVDTAGVKSKSVAPSRLKSAAALVPRRNVNVVLPELNGASCARSLVIRLETRIA